MSKSLSLDLEWARPIAASRADKRTLLLIHGVRLFHRQGVNGTGIAEIMDRAGVGKGQFYHYFASKEEFICEVVRYAMSYFLRRAASHLVSLARLEEWDAWFQPFVELALIPDFLGCPVGSMALEQCASSTAVQATVAEQMHLWIGAMTQGLQVFKATHGLGDGFDPESMAHDLAADIQGALLLGRAIQSTRYIYAVRERHRQALQAFFA
ncbi:TetR/AcrR family transcriptional regulator [bacterium]|nr:TetR/AcrR family transcriptional regulator [bacterium]